MRYLKWVLVLGVLAAVTTEGKAQTGNVINSTQGVNSLMGNGGNRQNANTPGTSNQQSSQAKSRTVPYGPSLANSSNSSGGFGVRRFFQRTLDIFNPFKDKSPTQPNVALGKPLAPTTGEVRTAGIPFSPVMPGSGRR